MLDKLRVLFGGRGAESTERIRKKLTTFRDLVEKNDRVLELIADAGEKLGGEYVFDRKYLDDLARDLKSTVHGVVEDLNTLTENGYPELLQVTASVDAGVLAALECRTRLPEGPYIVPLHEAGVEQAEVVGEKMGRLGEIASRLGCRVPDGFVVTTRACRELLERAGVLDAAEALRSRLDTDPETLDTEARELQAHVLAASVPRELARSIRREVDRLQAAQPGVLFAVRSSAADEDGTLTFAGQYETLLGVDADDVVDAYQQVVASLFSPSVLRYQRSHRLPPGCGLMAVGCLCMVPAKASGVAYTLNPAAASARVQLVTSTWGLGKAVVEGEAPADRFEVLREEGYPIVSSRVADKTWKYVARPGRGAVREPVSESERGRPSITPELVSELADAACRIERYMKAAQDIEWAVDEEGRLFILQARPLSIPRAGTAEEHDLTDIVSRYPVLLEGRGEVACRGIGIGRVHVLDGDPAAADVPPGAVLVARTASPRIGGLLAGASAVVTDLGSATGHFAAVARDFRVPTIVATGVATQTLSEGSEVTVDAEENVVYGGRIDELLRHQLLARSSFEDTSEFRLLRRMLRRIAPLRLRDPQRSGFTASQCRTYHDIIRFAHEKAIVELIDIGWVRATGEQAHLRRLDLPIPLDLILIDLGGGFRPRLGQEPATLEDVTSRPLLPLLEALTEEGIWETGPAEMDMEGFMSSATRSMALTGPLAGRPAQNLAIVGASYLHLSLRLGYHFNIVDVHLGDTPADNYIYFRFAGGVTELTRRSRRSSLLKKILEANGFVTDGREDLVIGRMKGLSADAMEERLRMIGRLIGFTRQLDVYLKNDRLVDRYVEQFTGGGTIRESPAPDNATETSMSGTADVLVLDDEPVVAERLKDHLDRKGYEVEVFTDSQTAIDRLAIKRFDVVITDLKMAGPTGLDVLRFVRDQSFGTQVIIITGYGSMDAARKAEFTGAFDFVNKPFSMKSLEGMTRKAARKARKLHAKEPT